MTQAPARERETERLLTAFSYATNNIVATMLFEHKAKPAGV